MECWTCLWRCTGLGLGGALLYLTASKGMKGWTFLWLCAGLVLGWACGWACPGPAFGPMPWAGPGAGLVLVLPLFLDPGLCLELGLSWSCLWLWALGWGRDPGRESQGRERVVSTFG